MSRRILAILIALALGLCAALPAGAESMEILQTADIDLESNLETDPADPLASRLAGMYETVLALEDGSQRSIYQYFPEDLSYRQPEVVVAMPSDGSADSFLIESGWKALADAEDFALVLLVPGEGGWQDDEMAYMRASYTFISEATYYMAQAAALYMVGYGDASSTVMDFAVLHSNMISNYFFSGFACLAVDDYDVSTLEVAKTTASFDPAVMMSEVPMPMWLGAKERTESVDALVEYWKAADECSDECKSDKYADEIYEYPAYMALGNELTFTHTSKVLLSLGERDYYDPEFVAHLYNDFLKRTRRYDSNLVNATRYFASNDEKGMDHVYLDVEGVKREFYVYVPTAVKSGELDKVPLVFCYHGNTCSGEDMPTRSGWDKMAEDHNFIAVFPTGGVNDSAFKLFATWTAEDLPFFKANYDYMLENYPAVDVSRVYVTGQSIGGMFTHRIGAYYPELVAATSVTSSIVAYSSEDLECRNEDLLMPVAEAMGSEDHRLPDEYWSIMYEMFGDDWFKRNGIDKESILEDADLSYENGIQKTDVFTNSAGVPLVRNTIVKDKVHAVIPDELELLYDFMSQYSRGEDGTLYYMGQPVTRD